LGRLREMLAQNALRNKRGGSWEKEMRVVAELVPWRARKGRRKGMRGGQEK